METKIRTFVKSTIWTLQGLLVMALVGFLATGSFVQGGAMALINAAIGFVMYGIYERFWSHIRWGLHE